ncbi:DNA-methyltransferase [Pseudothauera rhizosphaerae]|uniref:Methyltransferase n=1 Tax=Pseudothauera rhizosphaerae TaxID=2565932 RepID=A0A4S4AWD0_9RHOO|nr:DNA methyltransferase [Pseudothauera rhizosphaerae]THF64342.1 site-specific DNA-methyltransferase [Pseudothauera rhizosphaerae]
MNNIIEQAFGEGWAAYNADCVKFAQSLPDNSIDISVYSPPFSSLYVYSESVADMGNVASDEEFIEQYRYLVREKFRVLRPGRLTAIHVKDLVFYQNASADGSAGLRPFSDLCTQLHLEEGFTFHCRITIWRDPVLERAKTNAHGLLWKTFQRDASFCRVGMPEYLLVFRKWAKPGEEDLVRPVVHPKSRVPLEAWQELASPVWNYQPGQSGRGDFDLPATDVLNAKQAHDPDAEKHLCPMPLNITKRALALWSNEGEVMFSPFGGIGSEGVAALSMNRRAILTELHPAYYQQAVKNLSAAETSGHQADLFGLLDIAPPPAALEAEAA